MKRIAIIGVMLLFVALGYLLTLQITPPVPSAVAPVPVPAEPVTPAAPSAPAVVPVPPVPPAPAKAAAPAPVASLIVSRMVIARSVEDRQPVDIAASFPASLDGVYCFLDLTNVAKDQVITYAWTFGQATERVTQHIKKSRRWRTWSYRATNGKKGDWKVDVLDESGAMLKSTKFKVE